MSSFGVMRLSNGTNFSINLFKDYLPYGRNHGSAYGNRRNVFEFKSKSNVNIRVATSEGVNTGSLPYARYEVYCNDTLIGYSEYQSVPVSIDVNTSSSDTDKIVAIKIYNSKLNDGSMPPIDVSIRSI